MTGRTRLATANSTPLSDLGQRRVSQALASEAAALGCLLVENLLLDAGDATAQLKHVLVDEYGILLIESNDCEGSARGTSANRTWSASHHRRRLRFPNLLRQNDRNRQVLQRLLVASGRDLPARYLQSLVVFTAADLDRLRLDEVDALRVIPECDLIDFIRARYDFPPNEGGLDRSGDRRSRLVPHVARQVQRSRRPRVARQEVASASKRFEWRRPKRPERAPLSTATRVHLRSRRPLPRRLSSREAPSTPDHSGARLGVLVVLLLVLAAVWLVAAGGSRS